MSLVPQASEPIYGVVQSPTIPSGNGSAATTGSFGANPERRLLFFQNLSTSGPVYLLYGTGAIGLTNFTHILGVAPTGYLPSGFGAGGILKDNAYKGPVQFSGGANVFYSAWWA